MTPAELLAAFGFNDALLHMNLDAMSHEDSLVKPKPGGNTFNWVFGHIVYWRNQMLTMLAADALWTDDARESYRGKSGSDPGWTAEDAIPFHRLVEEYGIAHDRLSAALQAKENEDLGDLARSLAQLQSHECYHIGQLGVLRRVAGKEGAIPPRR